MSVQSEIQRIEGAKETLRSNYLTTMPNAYIPGVEYGESVSLRIGELAKRNARGYNVSVCYGYTTGYEGVAIPDYLDDYDTFYFVDHVEIMYLTEVLDDGGGFPKPPSLFNVDHPNWNGRVYGHKRNEPSIELDGTEYFLCDLLADGTRLISPSEPDSDVVNFCRALIPLQSRSNVPYNLMENSLNEIFGDRCVVILCNKDSIMY